MGAQAWKTRGPKNSDSPGYSIFLIKTSTRRVVVDIALPTGSPGPYDVRLETKLGEGPKWSAKLLPLVGPSGDARLFFDIPAQSFRSGLYSFVVSSQLPGSTVPAHYDFEAVVSD